MQDLLGAHLYQISHILVSKLPLEYGRRSIEMRKMIIELVNVEANVNNFMRFVLFL